MGLKLLILTVDKTVSNLNEVLEAYEKVKSEAPGVFTRKGCRDKTVENLVYAYKYVVDEVESLLEGIDCLNEQLILMLAKCKIEKENYVKPRRCSRRSSKSEDK